MAPISGRPFLEIQLDYLIEQGIQSVTLCTGHLSEVIETHFKETYRSLDISYSVETSPLGTGGAIKQALSIDNHEQVVVLNGDSYFGVDLQKMMIAHTNGHMTLALKHMRSFDRYGTVAFDRRQTIRQFKEKEPTKAGWINGGVYIINRSVQNEFPKETVFSFETFMADIVPSGKMKAFLSDGYFIDIGIPEDYDISQTTLPILSNDQYRGWTLFLDRDGVINERRPDDYVKTQDEWVYTEGALDAISQLSLLFDKIVVVTNQQGVAKGLMKSYNLDLIHKRLKDDVAKHGGHISQVYASLDLATETDNSRKPNVHMANWAKKDFPEIDFQKSIMVGDSASDIAFGQAAGMQTAGIAGKTDDAEKIANLKPNWTFESLAEMASHFIQSV